MELNKLHFFRGMLEQKISGLLNDQVKTLMELTVFNGHCSDVIDQASLEIDSNFELRIRDRERRLISKIHEALERIDDGTYGLCDDCGEEISEKRLIARPMTTLCIACKTKQEKMEKFMGKWGNGHSMRFDYTEIALHSPETPMALEE